ncbi:MAG: 50S ribosomal protein L10 [Clostridia bacterium]|nr:50S ribosomal protein L10 [Clostridia bacterium]MBQ1934445.1 50S ribosomal protein L10 [Clostridia bacterium]
MPSKVILEKKQAEVEALVEKLQNSVSGVLVQYQGITVEDDTKMRAALRNAGVDYAVIKNSITGRACDQVGFSDMKAHLEGMTAIAISKDDPIAPAKILKEYDDKVESFKIKAGYIDGKVVDADTVMQLASIPPKEVLLGKLLGSLKSPLCKLCAVLNAKIEKDGGAPAEA